jgi:hypothetical protein
VSDETLSFDVNTDSRKDVVIYASKYDDTSPRIVRIAITHEGIIMDFYNEAELSATVGMTFTEWFEFSERML